MQELEAELAPVRNNMRLEWMDPRTLAAHSLNWKEHPSAQRQAYAEFKSEVGLAGTLLLNERTGNLIDGHMRLEDSLEKNEAEVPVLVIDVAPEVELRILAYLDLVGSLFHRNQAALNRLADLADSRSSLLRSLLQVSSVGDDEEDDADDEGEGLLSTPLPEGGVSLVLGESYNYVVLLFRTELDWVSAQDHFGVQEVKCVFCSGVGLGRVIDGGEYLRQLRRHGTHGFSMRNEKKKLRGGDND